MRCWPKARPLCAARDPDPFGRHLSLLVGHTIIAIYRALWRGSSNRVRCTLFERSFSVPRGLLTYRTPKEAILEAREWGHR
jgi:hypothetical protein